MNIAKLTPLAKAAYAATQPELNFTMSAADMELCGKIAARGIAQAKAQGVELDHITCLMDICALHCNGTPLHLLRWLMSDNADFSDDFIRMGLNINRTTGKMMNGEKLRFQVNQ